MSNFKDLLSKMEEKSSTSTSSSDSDDDIIAEFSQKETSAPVALKVLPCHSYDDPALGLKNKGGTIKGYRTNSAGNVILSTKDQAAIIENFMDLVKKKCTKSTKVWCGLHAAENYFRNQFIEKTCILLQKEHFSKIKKISGNTSRMESFRDPVDLSLDSIGRAETRFAQGIFKEYHKEWSSYNCYTNDIELITQTANGRLLQQLPWLDFEEPGGELIEAIDILMGDKQTSPKHKNNWRFYSETQMRALLPAFRQDFPMREPNNKAEAAMMPWKAFWALGVFMLLVTPIDGRYCYQTVQPLCAGQDGLPFLVPMIKGLEATLQREHILFDNANNITCFKNNIVFADAKDHLYDETWAIDGNPEFCKTHHCKKSRIYCITGNPVLNKEWLIYNQWINDKPVLVQKLNIMDPIDYTVAPLTHSIYDNSHTILSKGPTNLYKFSSKMKRAVIQDGVVTTCTKTCEVKKNRPFLLNTYSPSNVTVATIGTTYTAKTSFTDDLKTKPWSIRIGVYALETLGIATCLSIIAAIGVFAYMFLPTLCRTIISIILFIVNIPIKLFLKLTNNTNRNSKCKGCWYFFCLKPKEYQRHLDGTDDPLTTHDVNELKQTTVDIKKLLERIKPINVLILCLLLPLAMACDNNLLVTSSFTDCLDDGVKETCSITTVAAVTLPYIGSSTCLRFSDNTTDTYSEDVLQITYSEMFEEVSLLKEYTTSNWATSLSGSTKCWTADGSNCGSKVACTIGTSQANPCNQFATVSPIGNSLCGWHEPMAPCWPYAGAMYARCDLWAQSPVADVYSFGARKYAPKVIISYGDQTIIARQTEATILNISFNLVAWSTQGTADFGTKKLFKQITDEPLISLIAGCERNQPVIGLPGDLQVSELADFSAWMTPGTPIAFPQNSLVLETTSGGYATCKSEQPGYTRVKYGCLLNNTLIDPNAEEGFVSCDQKSLALTNQKTLKHKITNPGFVTIKLEFKNLIVSRKTNLVCPVIDKASITGCYTCSKAATLTLYAKSSCAEGSALLSTTCNVSIADAAIKLTNEFATYKVTVNSGIKSQNCTVSLGQGTKMATISVSFTLDPENITLTTGLLTSSVAAIDTANPFNRLFNGVGYWYDYLIIIAIILCAVLIVVLSLVCVIKACKSKSKTN